uniref:Uncharacterized protein n=1 Tax=Megaselia scalaris TaxID=36166 RepID=T1GXQ2_MEGSC
MDARNDAKKTYHLFLQTLPFKIGYLVVEDAFRLTIKDFSGYVSDDDPIKSLIDKLSSDYGVLGFDC